MKVEIEIISNPIVKPSSPTPIHLQTYKLSFLDQVQPPMFMPLVLFYPADKSLSNAERSNKLKESLPQTLTRFYPLAGRLIDNSHINCNDEGVPYFEARANCKLSDVLNDPVPGEMNKFLPYELDDLKSLGMVIQVSFFECGGMAVGIGISHKVADAMSHFIFTTSWAAISRGEVDMPSRIFEPASLFPPRDMGGFRPNAGMVKQYDKVTKRFVFTASKIAMLRENYESGANDENSRCPTRIETLSAFIWTRFVAATQAKGDPNKIYALVQAVNLRTRIDPPLPEYFFGNVSQPAITILSSDNNDKGYSIVKKIREAIRNVVGDYVTNIQEGRHLNFLTNLDGKVNKGEVVEFCFTSLSRFPLYEADFGWGRPVWVGSASLNFKNLVVFLDTQSGDGIEAWVNMEEEAMAKLEADKQFLSIASSSSDAKSSV